jgi:hypothetical protein
MIVFDLKCTASSHVFEGWFGSSADYESQRERGLLVCPMCGDSAVEKAVMAPAIAAKGNRASAQLPVPIAKAGTPSDAELKNMFSELATVQREALKSSTWVGKDFDRQARAMDAGETDKASIHGEVTKREAQALVEDGIGVLPLPFPVVPPEQSN